MDQHQCLTAHSPGSLRAASSAFYALPQAGHSSRQPLSRQPVSKRPASRRTAFRQPASRRPAIAIWPAGLSAKAVSVGNDCCESEKNGLLRGASLCWQRLRAFFDVRLFSALKCFKSLSPLESKSHYSTERAVSLPSNYGRSLCGAAVNSFRHFSATRFRTDRTEGAAKSTPKSTPKIGSRNSSRQSKVNFAKSLFRWTLLSDRRAQTSATQLNLLSVIDGAANTPIRWLLLCLQFGTFSSVPSVRSARWCQCVAVPAASVFLLVPQSLVARRPSQTRRPVQRTPNLQIKSPDPKWTDSSVYSRP